MNMDKIPGKSILKAPKPYLEKQDLPDVVPPDVVPFIMDKGIVDDKSFTYNSRSNISIHSIGRKRKCSIVAVLASLLIIKIICFDIWITLGNSITDFLLGLFLMFDFQDGFAAKEGSLFYGELVLIACWVPGLVALLHMLAHYRDEFFGVQNQEEKNRKSGKRKILLILIFCVWFYPFLPVGGHVLSLWHFADVRTTHKHMESLTSIGQNINGCIKAPIQLIMTTWLMMKGVLDIPWRLTDDMNRLETQITIWTLFFSFVEFFQCAIGINIFNFHFGQLRSLISCKRYVNLVAGHFPFFCHAICFRVITFAFLFIYLDTKAFIPIFLIWLCNIFIGYATVTKYKIPANIQRSLKRIQLLAVQRSEMSEGNSTVQRKKSNDSIPVWLNSCLGIFVPSCSVDMLHPALFTDTDGLTEKQKAEQEMVEKEIFQHQHNFQQRVIKYQIQTSTSILMLSLASVCYLVNFTRFIDTHNIFSNTEFNIICCVILGLGIISYTFLFGTDVFSVFHLNTKPGEGGEIMIKYKEMKRDSVDSGKDVPDGVNVTVEIPGNPDHISYYEKPIQTHRHGPCKKAVVSAILTLVSISPIPIGYTYNYNYNLQPLTPAYVLMTKTDNGTTNTQIAKAIVLNDPSSSSSADIEGRLKTCDKKTVNVENLLRCKTGNRNWKNEILLVDLTAEKCLEHLDKMDDIECLHYKGIILLENWKYSSSPPVNLNTREVKSFPILSIPYKEAAKVASLLKTGKPLNIRF